AYWSAVRVAPGPEQELRRRRKGEAAITKGVLRHDDAYDAAGHVEHADALTIIARDVLGPGERAIVRAGLRAGGQVLGVAADAVRLVKECLRGAVRCPPREYAVCVSRWALSVVSPAVGSGGRWRAGFGHLVGHVYSQVVAVRRERREHLFRILHL